jgi:hypothetical protein
MHKQKIEKLKKFKAIDLNYGRYTKIIEVAKIIIEENRIKI